MRTTPENGRAGPREVWQSPARRHGTHLQGLQFLSLHVSHDGRCSLGLGYCRRWGCAAVASSARQVLRHERLDAVQFFGPCGHDVALVVLKDDGVEKDGRQRARLRWRDDGVVEADAVQARQRQLAGCPALWNQGGTSGSEKGRSC